MTAAPELPEDPPASDVISLGDRLKAERAERGISQSQAARELDVARTAYRLWELEAARPSPDRWRLVARWLGVSMSTLLLAEGLISVDEDAGSGAVAGRDGSATGEAPDDAAVRETEDFFLQARSLIDRSLERGVVSVEEAAQFRAMFDRIRVGLAAPASDDPPN
jgi:transcriptional regulator with XRE-family HTH domain